MVGRIGGDEFIAFMSISEAEMAKERAEELVKALHKYMEPEGIHITASIGVALARGTKTDFEVLYKTADYALYQAKKQGRDRYVITEIE